MVGIIPHSTYAVTGDVRVSLLMQLAVVLWPTIAIGRYAVEE